MEDGEFFPFLSRILQNISHHIPIPVPRSKGSRTLTAKTHSSPFPLSTSTHIQIYYPHPHLHPLSFVTTLLHPLFFTSGAARVIEVQDDPATGSRQITQSIKVTKYLDVPPAKGVFMDGQPTPQVTPSPSHPIHFPFPHSHLFPFHTSYTNKNKPKKKIYYHRPLHLLLSTFFKTGSLVLDNLEEPNFDLDKDAKERARVAERLEAARNFTQIPKILAFRLRKVMV
jgi:hypothetical protein